ESEERDDDSPVKKISTRSVGRALPRRSGLKEVQEAISEANNFRVKPVKLPSKPRTVIPRTIIDTDVEPLKGGDITTGELPRPGSLGSPAIRYWGPGRKQ